MPPRGERAPRSLAWTAADDLQLAALAVRHSYHWADVAYAFNRSSAVARTARACQTRYWRISTPSMIERERGKRRAAYMRDRKSVKPQDFRALVARIQVTAEADQRTSLERMFGDPPPGRSALDQRNRG